MKIRWEIIILVAIIILATGLKFALIHGIDQANYNSYYTIRQVEHVRSTGRIIHDDPLSYQGRTHVGSALFYYIAAIFSFFVPIILILKYGSLLFFILSLVFIFLITKKLFPAKYIALLVTILAAFTTSLFTFSMNTFIPTTMFFFMYILLMYVFLTKKLSKESFLFVLLFILTAFISSKILVLVLGAIIYFTLSRLEFIPLRKREFEVLFFSGIFAVWYYSVFYKKFFVKGISTLWNSVPKDVLSNYFAGLSLPLMFSFIGIVPMLLGFYALYHVLFNERNRKLLFLVSLTIAWSLFTWAGFIQFREGLVYVTLHLVLLSGYTINRFGTYFKKTKISFIRPVLAVTLIVLVVLSFIPSLSYTSVLRSTSPTQDEISTAYFLSQQGNSSDTILASVEEGHFITALTKKKTVFDEEFDFAPKSPERWNDVKKIFLTKSEVAMKKLLDAYDVTYVYISRNTIKRYGYQDLFDTSDCLSKIYETNSTEVYEVQCN